MENQFQVNDTVYCTAAGKGKIISTDGIGFYPIVVLTENGVKCTYTKDGRLLKDGKRTLFFETVTPHDNAFVRPKKVLYKAGAVLKFCNRDTEYIRELALDYSEDEYHYRIKSEYINRPSFDIRSDQFVSVEVIRE